MGGTSCFCALAGARDLRRIGDPEMTQANLRSPVAMLARIDRAANRLGLTRSGFIVLSTAERLTRMEAE